MPLLIDLFKARTRRSAMLSPGRLTVMRPGPEKNVLARL
jgi:hypothetical protein